MKNNIENLAIKGVRLDIKELMNVKGGTVNPTSFCTNYMCKRHAVKCKTGAVSFSN